MRPLKTLCHRTAQWQFLQGKTAIYYGNEEYFDDKKMDSADAKFRPWRVCDKTASALPKKAMPEIPYLVTVTWLIMVEGCC